MKCSIITIHHIHNFGSVFQAYALYHFLKLNGYNTEIIDYRPKYYNSGRNKIKSMAGKIINAKPYLERKNKFESFIKKYDELSESRFVSLEELQLYYRNKNEIFIAGGDQLWNNYHPCGNDNAYKLTFANTGKKIAYGTSMGRDDFGDDELTTIANTVSDFSSIMLREQSTISMLAKHSSVPVSHVIDPVGLLDVDEFVKIAKAPNINEPYAVMYLADSSEILDRAINLLSSKLGFKIVHICGFRKKCFCDRFEKNVGPEEILGYILNANFVLSASFHATMFSLLFNKQFVTLLPGIKTNARIEDLLRYVGLEHRIVHSVDELCELEKIIDYRDVNQRLEKLKSDSAKRLIKTLAELSGD